MSGTKYIASNWRLPENSNSSKNDNYSLSFDGSAEVLTWGQTDLPAAHTISFWVKMGGSSSDYRTILIDTTYAAHSAPVRRIYLRFGELIYIDTTSTGGSTTFETTNDVGAILTDGDWHHVALVRNDTVGTIYIDNVDKTDDAAIGSLTTPYYLTRTGEHITGYSTGDFLGDLSDICFFDYALNSPQIESLAGRAETGAGNPMALKPTPVAYYPLGDNSSGDPLTQPNASVDDASVFDFDGSPQIINLGNDASLYPQTGDMSYSFWVNPDVLSGYQTLYGITGSSTGVKHVNIELLGSEVRVFMGVGVSGQWGVNTGGGTGGASLTTTSSGLTVGQWSHVAVTLDRDGNGVIYIDGDPNVTAAMNPNDYSGVDIVNTANNLIGNGNGFVNGKISNVQVWNSNLSASEVSTLYNSGVPLLTGTQPQVANLEAWYKLDQSANWDIPLGISNEWQVGDATSDFEDSFFLNRSSFVDDIDAIPIDHAAINNISEEITVALWVKTTYSGAYTHSYFILRDQVGGIYRNFNLSKDHWYPGGTGKYVYWTVWNAADNSLVANMQSGSTAPDGSPYISIVDGKWHHVVGTYGSDTVSLYIDGILQNSNTNVGQGNIKVNVPDTTLLGRNYSSKNQGYNSGYNSNAQIWDKALTAGEVATLYNNGKPINVLSSIPQNSNLKGWWALDNTATYNSGASTWSIPDKSGNSYDITGVGMSDTVLQPGMVSALNGESSGMTSGNLVLSDLTRNLPYENYSLDFDGTEYIDCGDSDDFSFGNGTTDSPFSVSFWVNLDSIPSAAGFFAKDYDASNREWTVGTFSSAGKIRFLIKSLGGGNQQSIDSTTILSTGQWYHITCTYDGSGGNNAADGLTIYINGIAETPTNITKNTYVAMSNTTAPLTIGIYQLGGTPLGINGKFSNTSIFNVELTSTEVLKLYANGMPQDLTNFTPQPVSWWTLGKESFWNGSNWIVRDMIGSNDGTSANMAVNDLVGDAPRSEANGTGTNMDIPTNLIGNAGFSDKNAYSINMGPEARVTDTP